MVSGRWWAVSDAPGTGRGARGAGRRHGAPVASLAPLRRTRQAGRSRPSFAHRAPLIAHLRVTIAILSPLAAPQPVSAQAAFHPAATTPAAWERFAARVVNATGDTAVVEVRVDVPGAVAVLGVEPVPGWETVQVRGTDSTPHRITWRGGTVGAGDLEEFAFLGRVAGDAGRATLVFPVTLTRADGQADRTFAGRVAIEGATRLSARGALAVAATAFGLALVALLVALSRRAPIRTD